MTFAVLNDTQFVSGEHAIYYSAEEYLYAVVDAILEELLSQVYASDSCSMMFGSKEFMDLFK